MHTISLDESVLLVVPVTEWPLADGLIECCSPLVLPLGHLGAMWPGSPQLKQTMLVFWAACAADVFC